MNKQHIVNATNALILIGVGLFSYFSNETRPLSALIAPLVGFILLSSSSGLKSGNKHIGHLVAAMTLLFAIACIVQFTLSLDFPDEIARSRRLFSFGIMSFSNLLATVYYVRRFIWIKRNK
jgi:hypothetical protein